MQSLFPVAVMPICLTLEMGQHDRYPGSQRSKKRGPMRTTCLQRVTAFFWKR